MATPPHPFLPFFLRDGNGFPHNAVLQTDTTDGIVKAGASVLASSLRALQENNPSEPQNHRDGSLLCHRRNQ